jgi:hypothetical protein
MATVKRLLTDEVIIDKIYIIRGQKIMLDKDLAELYRVSTGNLNKAVRRNLKRFPKDFMFRLTRTEFENLRFQNGISSWGGSRYLPMAFTEQGVSMLSGVLNSKTAIEVHIRIIRVFAMVKEMLLSHKDILVKLKKIEKDMIKQKGKMKKYEEDIRLIFEALKELLSPAEKPRPKIGFRRSYED